MLTEVKTGIERDYDLGEKIDDGNFGDIIQGTNRFTDERVAIKVIDKKRLKGTLEPKEDESSEPDKKKEVKKKKKGKKKDDEKMKDSEEKDEKKEKKKVKEQKKGAEEKADADNKTINEEGLIREVTILKLCQHPHIVKYISFYEDTRNYYIVMEFVEGGDLLSFVNSQTYARLNERDAQLITGQLVSAIEYCHRNLIAHRDIKLENILLSSKEKMKIKLADFGLSNFINPAANHMTFCGTPIYAAPEIIVNDKNGYDPMLVDIWSLGVVIYIINAGKIPWDGKTIAAQVTHISSCILHPDKFQINYPDWFSNDLKDLLQQIFKKPDERIKLTDIKKHPWVVKFSLPSFMKPRERVDNIDPLIVERIIALGFSEADVLVSVFNNKNNQITALYHIIKERYGNVIQEIAEEKRKIGLFGPDFSKSDPALYNRCDMRRGSPRKKLTPRHTPISRILEEETFVDKRTPPKLALPPSKI